MSVESPWAKHYQAAWEARSGDARLPDWLRVASLAYGKHKANGHAVLPRDALGWVLAKPDLETGEIKRCQNVSRAIALAVRNGFLHEESNARCLVVPWHAIEGGVGGTTFTQCPVHELSKPTRAHLTAARVELTA